MAHDSLRDTTLVRGLRDLVSDLSDLISKEVRLARAEIGHQLALRVRSVAWMGVAGVLGLLAGALIVEGAVFALAATGLALHWSCFLIAGLLIVLAALAVIVGRAGNNTELAPRSMRQFNETIKTAKEQLR
jgi:hypothetical protein